MKKRWWVLIALILGGLLWANRRRFTVHDITTGESAAYPELRSRVYYAAPDAVLLAAEQALQTLPRWQLTHKDTPNHALDAQVHTWFANMTDDVTVYVTPMDGSQTRVIIRARTNSKSDGGRCAIHIRQLQVAMDAQLTREATF
jgi:hypothetical protein